MNRKLRDVLILVAASLMLLWAIPSVGQVLKGSISGTVVDPQGAVLSNAQVKATHTATGAVLTTKSDNSGLFRFNLIPAGTYKVEISAQGFKNSQESDIIVVAGRDTSLGEMRLAVGGATETVEVTAAAPLIETTQSQITNTFSGTTLQTFAGIQENQGLDNLALFVPGVASVRDNSFSNTNGGVGFSSNGLRGRNNDQEIDGQNNNDNSVAGPGLFVSDTEFVQQYVLVTNQFGPEYGRNSGSVVNIITKSGTNAWHGSLYGVENNSVLNSMSAFQKNFGTDAAGNPLTKPPRMNDEFTGGTVGGPVVKNKVFVFGGFDNEIVSENSVFHSDSLTPTPAGIATLSTCFPTSATVQALKTFGPYGIKGGNPFATNPITPTSGANFIAACPGVQYGGVTRVVPTPQHSYNFPVRVDWQSGNDSVMGRYLYNKSTFFNISDNGAAGYVFSEPALSQAALASWTHNFSSRMVNETRLSFGRLNVEFGGNSIGNNSEPIAGQLDQALANITFSAAANALGFGPATNLPQQRIVNTWQGQDNWNYVMGKHALKAGVNWTYQRSPNIFLPNINGQFRFSNWGRFATNTPNRIRIASGPSGLDFREYDTFAYAGDDWKLSQHLTLNLGLTWTFYGQPANLFNTITTKRESNSATAFWASTEPTGTDNLGNNFGTKAGAAIPLSARTDPSIAAPKTSFGPSLGFAYSPSWGGLVTGHGKTTIRGGYRYLYDPPFYNIYLNVSTAAPEVFLNTVPSPGTHPLPAVPIGPNVRSSLKSAIQLGAFDPREFAQTQISPNFGPDKVHSWNIGFEREITKNSALEVRYVGNAGRGLFQTLDGNPKIDDLQRDFPKLVPAGLKPCTAGQALFTNAAAPFGGFDPVGRLNCNEAVVRARNNSGFSNYQAVQVEFRSNNLFKQLTIRSGYTFSKNLDNVSEIFSTVGGGNTVFFAQNPANQVNGHGEYSFSGLDYPHTWTILFTEQLPFFKEQHGIVGHMLGGWAFSGDYIIQSGQRYTPIQASAIAAGTANGDYYDFGYIANFAGFDTARPFLGNLSAPQTSMGGYAQDLCNLFGNGTLGVNPATDPVCGAFSPAQANQLFSMTALGQSCLALNNATPTCTVQSVTKGQVRFILNASTAQTIFGTPFGDTPRNPVQDAITNTANFSIFKRFKISERIAFEMHASLLNVFNHPNFTTIDPVVEDAGLNGFVTGFGNPKLSDDIPGVVNFPVEATRRVIFGGKISF